MSGHPDLPLDWVKTTVGTVCDIAAGNGFPKRLQGKSEGDLPFFKVGDISNAWRSGSCRLERAQHYLTLVEVDAIRARPLPTNAVVFAKIGEAISLNRRALLAQPSLIDNNCMGVWADSCILDARLLFHFLCTVRLGDAARASVVPSLRQSDIADVPIPIPPLPEQHRIVAKIEELFSDLDAGVAALKRVKANLKRYRASVLKAAVEGRLTEEWRKKNPATEPAAKLLERILAERRAKWEADQLRKFQAAGKTPPKDWSSKYRGPIERDSSCAWGIPENWIQSSLDSLSHRLTYGITVRPVYQVDGVPLISGREIRSGAIDMEIANRISKADFAGLRDKCKLEQDDILFGKTGTIGTVARVKTREPLCVAQNVAVISPLCVPAFLEVVMRSPQIQRVARESVKTTAIPDLHLGRMAAFSIPLPPWNEQLEIVAEVDRRLSVADAAEQQVEHALLRATRLRQAILKRAFEGKLVPKDTSDGSVTRTVDRSRLRKAEAANA